MALGIQNTERDNLSQRILSLYREREYEDAVELTILDSDINQIRHIFYLLRGSGADFEVSYGPDLYRGRVQQVDNYSVQLRIPNFVDESIRRCRLKLSIFEELYKFEVSIISVDRDIVTIRTPAFIQSVSRRKYARYTVNDLYIKLIVLYQPVIGARQAEQMIHNRFPAVIQELKKDDPDISLINRIITEEIFHISPHFDIKFYKKGKPKPYIERLLEELGRTIFISDTGLAEDYYERRASTGLANYNRDYTRLVRESSVEEANAFYESIRKEDNKNFIRNYVLSPLKIFNKIVGRIHIRSSLLETAQISEEKAQIADLLSQLLNYGMSKKAISRTYYQHAVLKVRNMSMQGMLFEVPDEDLFDYLTLHDRVKIILPIRYYNLEFTAEIARFLPGKSGYLAGANFLEMEEDTVRILEQYLYEIRTGSVEDKKKALFPGPTH